MKNRILSFLIIMSLIVGVMPTISKASETAALSLNQEEIWAATADGFTIPISITNNPGLMGLDMEVTYERDCVAALEVISDGLLKDETVNDSIETSTGNSFHIMWAGSDNLSEDGVLFKVKFRLINPTDLGYTNIKFSVNTDDTYNENYDSVPVEEAILKVNTPVTVKEKEELSLAVFMDDWTVGEAPSVPNLIGNTGNGNVKYEYADSPAGPYSGTIPSEAGNYYLKATVAETEDYYGGVTTCTFKILEKEMDIDPSIAPDAQFPDAPPSMNPGDEPGVNPGDNPGDLPGDQPGSTGAPSDVPGNEPQSSPVVTAAPTQLPTDSPGASELPTDSPSSSSEPSGSSAPSSLPTSSPVSSSLPTTSPGSISSPTASSSVAPSATGLPVVTPGSESSNSNGKNSNGKIKINLKNGKKYKKSKLVVVRATKGIKIIKINGKKAKIKKNKKKIRFRISKYKKWMKIRKRYNTILVIDKKNRKKKIRFKVR